MTYNQLFNKDFCTFTHFDSSLQPSNLLQPLSQTRSSLTSICEQRHPHNESLKGESNQKYSVLLFLIRRCHPKSLVLDKARGLA